LWRAWLGGGGGCGVEELGERGFEGGKGIGDGKSTYAYGREAKIVIWYWVDSLLGMSYYKEMLRKERYRQSRLPTLP